MSLRTSYSNIHVQLQESCNSTDIIYFESKSVVWGIGQYSHIISGPYHLQLTCKQYNLRKEGRVSEPYEPYAIKLRTAKKPSDGSYGLCANSLLTDENVAHTHADDHGATKVSRRKYSTAQVPLNASMSASSETVRNEPIPASTATTSEPLTRPGHKCSGSMSLESDVPPKRLRLGPLKGWGVERDGVSMTAVEYSQKHWRNIINLTNFHNTKRSN
ncbi:hypothetical protein C8J57DRAFT_1252682 [Mycena rebaudengoi]|nr:hypothetical protein C8J57DRAFT_1252682 [Mycena rebaudengoi]